MNQPFVDHTLPNGLRIVMEVMPDVKSAAAGFYARAGGRDETPELAGVSHFLEHMCFKGSAKRNWRQITVGNFSIRAPISSEQSHICETCADHCLLAIEQGTLAIFRAAPEESFEDAIALWAPDAQDISWRRSRPHKWRTIKSLVNRVESNAEPPRSFRFRTRRSKGVATISAVGNRTRLVIYAYSLDGTPTRLIGLTGTAIDLLYRTLGSLEVHAATSSATRDDPTCSIGTT